MTRSTVAIALLLASTAALADQGPTPDTNPLSVPLVGARTFDIGPNQPFTFDTVPWATLAAGDVVNIHYQPTPYVTKFGLRARGTANAPVVINGVTDSNGNRPVISFANSRTAALAAGIFSNVPSEAESRGGIVIKRGISDPQVGPKPSHIHIMNLELRDARGPYTTLQQTAATFSSAACINVDVGADILIQNVIATNCAFGIFTNAKGNDLSQTVQRITVRNSRIYANGVANSSEEHNVYLQADRPIFEGNYIGKTITGSQGASFKDRSAGLIFRRNYVESSTRALDLVHPKAQGIAALPHFGDDFVYENTINNNSSEASIRYGGDAPGGEQDGGDVVVDPGVPYRANLYFWNNTVNHTYSGARNIVFSLSLRHTAAHVWDNTFTFGSSTTRYSWLDYAGDLRMGTNRQEGGIVVERAREGANPAMYVITEDSPVPADPVLQSLL